MKKIVFVLCILIIAIYINIDRSSDPKDSMQLYLCPEDNCDQKYLNILKKGDKIKCSFFDLSDIEIIKELSAKNAEVMIDYRNTKHLNMSLLDNIYVIETNYLMHNKYCIVKNKTSSIVITGSYNPTEKNINKNNIVIFNSTWISYLYLQNFYDILYDAGDDRIIKTIKDYIKMQKKIGNFFSIPIIKIPFWLVLEKQRYNSNIYLPKKICFSPFEDCRKILSEELYKANNVDFIQFSFTDKLLASLVIKRKGIGLIEKMQANQKFSVFNYLRNNSVSVQKDNYIKFIHHKVFILDNNRVIIGSLNPSYSGYKNYENILIYNNSNHAKRLKSAIA